MRVVRRDVLLGADSQHERAVERAHLVVGAHVAVKAGFEILPRWVTLQRTVLPRRRQEKVARSRRREFESVARFQAVDFVRAVGIGRHVAFFPAPQGKVHAGHGLSRYCANTTAKAGNFARVRCERHVPCHVGSGVYAHAGGVLQVAELIDDQRVRSSGQVAQVIAVVVRVGGHRVGAADGLNDCVPYRRAVATANVPLQGSSGW